MRIRNVVAALIVIASLIFSCWLGIGVMLVGGIQQAIVGFSIMDISMAAWGIARAVLFEVGFFPLWISYIVAFYIMD